MSANGATCESYLNYYCSNGLLFIKGLVQSEGGVRQRELSLHHYSGTALLSDTFLSDTVRRFCHKRREEPLFPLTEDSQNSYSVGWFRARKELRQCWMFRHTRSPMRDWAYVFWSEPRLDNIVLKCSRYEYNKRWSVEDKLCHVLLEEPLLRKVYRKYYVKRKRNT